MQLQKSHHAGPVGDWALTALSHILVISTDWSSTCGVQADELQANLVSQTRLTQLANADRDNALVKYALLVCLPKRGLERVDTRDESLCSCCCNHTYAAQQVVRMTAAPDSDRSH